MVDDICCSAPGNEMCILPLRNNNMNQESEQINKYYILYTYYINYKYIVFINIKQMTTTYFLQFRMLGD